MGGNTKTVKVVVTGRLSRKNIIHERGGNLTKMGYYYLNRNQQPSGDYEVHLLGCSHGAQPQNQIGLGTITNAVPAVAEAKRRFPDHANSINGCAYCAPEANTD